jgi:hypothetical protein
LTVPKPEDLHEYVSFEDPNEDRTWVFDATFLMSNYECIFGRGCQGVLDADATDMNQGCCSYGAHMLDEDDVSDVQRHVQRLTPEHWQFHDKAKKRGEGTDSWLKAEKDGTEVTRLVDDACIFLNRPGFAGGAGCAFHVAAEAAGERPLDWKPDVCWQVPVRRSDETEADGHITTTVREWKRRDWSEGGHEFHWWCTDSHEAFIGKNPAYQYLREELIEMSNPAAYKMLVKILEARTAVYLPHPKLKITRKKTAGK